MPKIYLTSINNHQLF